MVTAAAAQLFGDPAPGCSCCSPLCYFFNSARKLGVASMPICACLEVIVALPGVPGAPLIGSDRWVTCAEYIPSVIVAIRVEAENPVTSVPGLTAAVAVQVMLGVPIHAGRSARPE